MRSKKYQQIVKKHKLDQVYTPEEALKLIPQVHLAKFTGSLELHLTILKPGTYGKFKTERKFPLLHLNLGPADQKPTKALTQIQKAIQTIGINKIKKAVLSTSMSPGIKLQLS